MAGLGTDPPSSATDAKIAAVSRRVARVAVGAEHHTLRDLLFYDGPVVGVGHQGSDVVPLRSSNVMKLQYDRIVFATIRARVRFQIPQHELACPEANRRCAAARAQPLRLCISAVIPVLYLVVTYAAL